jgi:ribosomal protein S12 methylthiotransferase accessory factor
MTFRLLISWTPAEVDELSREAWQSDQPCVPVRYDGGLVLVGPLLRRGAPVCLTCAEDARLAVLGDPVPRVGLRQGGLISPTLEPVLAALTPDDLEGTVIAMRADQMTVTSHRVHPRPQGCPLCSPLPSDSPEAARVTRQPCPVRRGSLRAANPAASGEALRQALYDWRHGPVNRLYRTETAPLAIVTAELAREGQSGYGRSLSFAEAERVALFEAAERAAGMRPHRCVTVLQASFAELGPQRAVDPETLGLLDYGSTYTPRSRTAWVYGWSYARQAPVAVPQAAAYWGHAKDSFLTETSSGCSLGNSFTEAVLHGLFEVAERDAFLMAWYAKTPLPRVEAPPDDPIVVHLADRLSLIGYKMMFFNATNDLGVPAVLALARRDTAPRDAPLAFFAAGASHDPRAAIRSAAIEVTVDVASAMTQPGRFDRDRLLPMLDHPELVRTMADHVALNALPEAAGRHAFLSGDAPLTDWAPPPPVDDLQDLLDSYVNRLARLGLDVIAVNQTDPVTAGRLGLHSAKVLVPGALPMTFGHLRRRTRGLPRLQAAASPLRYEELDLHPHPFP